jgi:predicted nucleic acid-binding protein
VSVYLDASVIVPALTAQSMSLAAISYLQSAPKPMWVSDLGQSEVASAASRMVRMRQLTRDQGEAMVADFDAWFAAEATPVEVDPVDFQTAIALVRRFELRLLTPDALHLAISARIPAELVTFDGRLAVAAQALGLAVRAPS